MTHGKKLSDEVENGVPVPKFIKAAKSILELAPDMARAAAIGAVLSMAILNQSNSPWASYLPAIVTVLAGIVEKLFERYSSQENKK